MHIKASDIFELNMVLEDARMEEKEWMCYDDQAGHVSSEDIHFFVDRLSAEKFSNRVVPVEPVLFILDGLLILQADKEVQLMDVTINVEQVIANYEKQQQKILLTLENYTRTEKNLEALKNNLNYLGFGEGLNDQLEKNIREQKSWFTLQHEVIHNNQKMQTMLSFKVDDQNDMTFFNKYSAQLDDKKQTFYLDRGNGVTTKEAFNLLQGRAVNKDLVNKKGEKYNAWIQLDFSKKEESGNYKMDRYHENYKYNLEEALSRYPLKELEDSKWKEDLMKSLEKGNIQAVKMEIGNKEELMYIAANPKERVIHIYDKAMNPLNESARKELGKKPEAATDTAQEDKNRQKQKNYPAGGDDDDGPELKKKRTRKKGLGV